MRSRPCDYIDPATARTLPGLFAERVRRSPGRCAYRYFDTDQGGWRDYSWHTAQEQVGRWATALRTESLPRGDRVAVMLRNRPEWVFFEQAALALGLVVVPLYTEDRADNVAYVLAHSGARLLLLAGPPDWQRLREAGTDLGSIERVLSLEPVTDARGNPRLRGVGDWLPAEGAPLPACAAEPGELATIVYTSGTTGRPKGVMLSHRNVLTNAFGGLQTAAVYPDDLFLSFLPLSHTLERTGGYYLPMTAGATVAYARSVSDLAEDLRSVQPTILISVPRIFERVYERLHARLTERGVFARTLFRLAVSGGWRRFEYRQGRGRWSARLVVQPLLQWLVGRKVLQRLGGRLRLAISGGAALPPPVARLFIGLGVDLCQGYGLTENSPVVSVNRSARNRPESVGEPLPGTAVRVADQGELWVRGPSVMLGYWRDPDATAAAVDAQGWLHTGDQVRIEEGYIYITGRLKDIIVLTNGEKVPPADLEMAIAMDPLIDQVMLLGEGRPYLAAPVVADRDAWAEVVRHHCPGEPDPLAADSPCRALLLERIEAALREFPGYAKVRAVALCGAPWTVDNGLLTPTMKPRRARIVERYRAKIEHLYGG